MAFRLKFAQARLDNKVTVQTLLKEFHQIMRTISRNTGTTWMPKDQIEMKKVGPNQKRAIFDSVNALNSSSRI